MEQKPKTDGDIVELGRNILAVDDTIESVVMTSVDTNEMYQYGRDKEEIKDSLDNLETVDNEELEDAVGLESNMTPEQKIFILRTLGFKHISGAVWCYVIRSSLQGKEPLLLFDVKTDQLSKILNKISIRTRYIALQETK